ncbi:MAG TPA: chemotaxis response regulator protein-glutamate methylesterase [Ramlibacter sp.]|jgi:two-component system chemotaxis response regulator CheB|uniref:protein-glutamate methylesterase/protein-glutamine glutaminase n=1 Tax=Ramlibacter sp. TaxID=1917967 RepID=UPI002D6DC30E|nr:chemotaxis response regulator protein-glutamate methylesterase [Ramlibacter sp.]HZY19170.1 chemotaxis response regulator protein-glutamate methylesterase [Ramlibacter sp.]
MTIRVVVVDDSALVRSVLTELINRTGDMRVVGAAADPYEARERIRELDPDVVTLDVEMPKMDGLAFLERLMKLRPTPVVMVSTLTERGAETTLRALELGAVDFVAKPTLNVRAGLDDLAREITGKLRAAAQARVGRRAAPMPVPQACAHPKPQAEGAVASDQLIAIGASTGGTEAIREILMALPAHLPGIVITQHMPAGFTASFAARLDTLCRLRVKEAADGDRILQGHAYIAPGGRHLGIERSALGGYVAKVTDGEPVNRHKPSVDVLFRSVARCAGARATGMMLTGMGADGATAMREMRDRGAWNLVQDEASCVVFGMPREAIAAGAANEVVPLPAMAQRLLAHLGTSAR